MTARQGIDIRAAIPEAYIVGSLGEAIERAKERPGATFVTLEGDVVRGPLLIGGKTEGAVRESECNDARNVNE